MLPVSETIGFASELAPGSGGSKGGTPFRRVSLEHAWCMCFPTKANPNSLNRVLPLYYRHSAACFSSMSTRASSALAWGVAPIRCRGGFESAFGIRSRTGSHRGPKQIGGGEQDHGSFVSGSITLSCLQHLLCAFALILFTALAVWFCFYLMYSGCCVEFRLSCLQRLLCGFASISCTAVAAWHCAYPVYSA